MRHLITYGIIFIIFFYRKKDLKLSRGFWIKSALGFIILGFDRSFDFYYQYLRDLVPPETAWFYYKLLYNSMSFFSILIPLIILKLIFDRRTGEGLYGLRVRKVDLRPYWIMLLIMTPIIYVISFTPDFIDYYPIYKRTNGSMFSMYYHIPEILSKFIFEFFYITDIVYTELFFRGFLIIGFIK